jgi:hypothetical protein
MSAEAPQKIGLRPKIGLGVRPTLTGVAVVDRTGAFSQRAARPSISTAVATAVPAEETEAARNESLGAIVRPKGAASASVAAAAAPAPLPTLRVTELPAAAAAARAPASQRVTEAPVVDLSAFVGAEEMSAEEKAAAEQMTATVKARIQGRERRLKEIPLPADAPILTKEEFSGVAGAGLKSAIQGTNPVEASPANKIYRPIISSRFSDFILETYAKYSDSLTRMARARAAGAAEVPKKEINKNACKERDPNKVTNFYYQKFVRDYLSRGTPYRGLLVYHGLGTGKTCTSIAAAEALYWGGQKTIYVLTPATLSNNYRRELSKCGYFPLRQNNYWAFLKTTPGREATADPMHIWLTQGLGLPASLVQQQGGGWVPNPDKPSNWESLSADVKAAIRTQQQAHLNHRFKFIHYNGVTPTVLSALASAGVAEGKSMFDDAVVIVDEIHNLVRTINGSIIGGKATSEIISKGVEPREFTWSTPLARARPGFRYPRGYTLYRLLTNAVGAKIIALSATPMINYAQELAVLMNIVGGEIRMAQISLKGMARDPATLRRLEEWAKRRTDIDFFAVEEADDKSTVLNVTPVPFGFSKVVSGDYDTRGFVRGPGRPDVTRSIERNMDAWVVGLIKEIEAAGILTGGVGAEAEAAVMAARAKGVGTVPETRVFRLFTFPLLPEDAKEFVSHFIDRSTLAIKHADLLKARSLGLVSYYRGGSEELMPRVVGGKTMLVEVPMSEYMFKEYTRLRAIELDMAKTAEPAAPEGGEGAGAKKRKGMTQREVDLYAQATKTQQTGFLALSRAACNWVFPEDVPRPTMSAKEQAKLLGIDSEARLIAADLAADTDIEAVAAASPLPDGIAAAAAGEDVAEAASAVLPDDAPVPETAPEVDPVLSGIIGTLMTGLDAKAHDYLNVGLDQFSPKYATMLANIRRSPGPVLVYSQFKTLEGLGIFAAALRAADEKYLPLDLQKNAAGEWEIPAVLMEAGRPRYILYTGDQDLDKRRLLLQLYNADVGGLPPRLAAQCTELLAGAPDNRDGRICKVFMITQSGAEGISLFNTRQVHLMEPYWNNVRIQQVVGRAIRLCSHMNLDWDERMVEVFQYLSVFSPTQRAGGSGAEVLRADAGKTTDQMIYEIATQKQVLADGLSEIVQAAAVDCELHYHEHGAMTQCYRFSGAERPMFTMHPDWRKDLQAPVKAAGGAGGGGGGGGGGN